MKKKTKFKRKILCCFPGKHIKIFNSSPNRATWHSSQSLHIILDNIAKHVSNKQL